MTLAGACNFPRAGHGVNTSALFYYRNRPAGEHPRYREASHGRSASPPPVACGPGASRTRLPRLGGDVGDQLLEIAAPRPRLARADVLQRAEHVLDLLLLDLLFLDFLREKCERFLPRGV